MIMEEVHRIYKDTFFLSVGKWGHQLTPTEAEELGLIAKKPRTKRGVTKDGDNTK